ncbi:MAG: DUF1385 domain-containing protein [Tissierella sp.]|uniref:DUF1385 domain-containing protein n=1 Tax=Tissierella sp. TaxID=41274 RepID=UPI003F9E10ED
MKENNLKHKTTIGGQAIIEGVMMKGPEKISMAVRKPDEDIELKVDKIDSIGKKYKLLSLPFIRGVVGLVEAMVVGTNALMYSADFFEEEEEIEYKDNIFRRMFKLKEDETLFEKIFKDKAEDVSMFLTVAFSITISILVFMILPNFLTSILKTKVTNPIYLNMIEGIIRVSIFFIYVIGISKLEDIKRVFEYHGAEHKSIHCYESMEELTVENVKTKPILHPRCGTSFLFMVMIISIFVLSFFGWPSPLQRILIRILMFPVIAGISYEVNRLIGRSDSKLSYYLSYPGLMIQKYATVREPDDSQIEVAIEALKSVIPDNMEDDLW